MAKFAESYFGDSRDPLECIGGGIAFGIIMPIFRHHMTGLLGKAVFHLWIAMESKMLP